MPPTGTYRLQLRREFGFAAAADVVPYLARLGVSHVYCSPVLEATPGSAHGYDVVDHRRLSPDLGGDAGWKQLVETCRAHGLGIVVDVVPNHMAVPTPESLNAALWDVLRHGRASAYASWFDVDWAAEDDRLLMPVLGQPLTDCVAAGEIEIDEAAGEVRYFDHRFPLAPDSAGGTTGEVLARQHYRLAEWAEGNERLNYRRFFDVTSLIGVRVEDPAVFAATHDRLLRLVDGGDVDGLRIDHPDGLADPAGYLDRLADRVDGRWVVVEKILEPGEWLPASWRCAGTTGYDAVRAVTHVLVDPAGGAALTDLYTKLTGEPGDFDEVVEVSKRLVLRTLFGAEIRRLLRDLGDAREPTAAALVELLVAFDVYRAYPGDAGSRARIDAAAARAAARAPHLDAEIHRLARLLDSDDDTGRAFAVRFAQTTGPVMAKGVEDTAFYRYQRMVALNEVGGSPGDFGIGVDEWHAFCSELARDWPATMTTLSTHDTKRSEDVRARLLVLAEIPAEWQTVVERWRTAAARHRPPDPNTDYLFWQTLVGAWPIEPPRLHRYLEKAVREAKQQTSWTSPDSPYERQLHDYVDGVLADTALVADVDAWVQDRLVGPGDSNSLAQKLLQLTMPGVPDVYQGEELPGRFLVDPDNRQPVDYDARRAQLEKLDAHEPCDPKLLVTAATLRVRRQDPGAFLAGDYTPVPVGGVAAEHVLAFSRSGRFVTVVTRLPVGLTRRGGWGDTRLELPPGEWHDVLTGRPVRSDRLGDLLDRLPVAFLAGGQG